jgi:hypothetical protein
MFNKFMFVLGFLPIMAFAEDFIHKIENSLEMKKGRFYVQPECFFAKKIALPGIGAGYRFHDEKFGFIGDRL